MAAVREWFKTIGGPVGLIASGVGFAFMLLPLGVGLIVIGALLWLYRWERFPFRISRRNRGEADAERRELLSLARAVSIELETCRRRLVRAESEHVGWRGGQKLPAETFNARWTPALVTADQTEVNDALRDFYVWADDINHHMARIAAAEYNAVGGELLLGADTVVPAREGISRVTNAQEHVNALIKRLSG